MCMMLWGLSNYLKYHQRVCEELLPTAIDLLKKEDPDYLVKYKEISKYLMDERFRSTTTTSTDDKKETSSTTTSSTTTQQEEKNECPICLGDIPMDSSTFTRLTCCGKGLHHHCAKLHSTKSKNIRDHCPLCRTKLPTNDEEVVEQLLKWVKKKKAWAQYDLGNNYFYGAHGVKKDVKRAFVLFTLAAEQGDANAQYELAISYRDGDGTKPDVKRALELYTLAAEQGLAKAQYNLGLMYGQGQGVEQSTTTAREWLEKAAAQGNEDAISVLKTLDEYLASNHINR